VGGEAGAPHALSFRGAPQRAEIAADDIDAFGTDLGRRA